MRSLVEGSGRHGSLRGMVIAGVCTVAIALTSTSTWATSDSPRGGQKSDASAAPSASTTTSTTTSPSNGSGDPSALLTVDGPKTPAQAAPQSVPANDVAVPPAADNAATDGVFGASAVALPSALSKTLTLDTTSGLDAKVLARVGQHDRSDVVVGAAAVSAADAARIQFLHMSPSAPAIGVRKDGATDAAAGATVSVDVIPQLDGGTIPGAAFAARLSLQGGGTAQTVDVAFDTSGLANAYGGDYADRLQFVALPACALTTPDVPGCLDGALLETRRDANGIVHVYATASGAMSLGQSPADPSLAVPSLAVPSPSGLGHGFSVPLPAFQGLHFATTSGGTIIAAVSGANSQSGTFKATDLAPRGTWGVSEPTGSFTYSIPITVPPVTAGPVPNLDLSYSSQSTDGKSFASNAQASVIGEGWTMPVSYIERLYKPCSADPGPSTSGDLCWASPYAGTGAPAAEAAYVLSLNGRTEELVWTDTDTANSAAHYVAASDPTLKVTRYFGAAGRANNGDDNGEWFEVKASDGTRYWFGYEPYGPTNPTHSIAYEPVQGNTAGEPGYGVGDGFVNTQAYRFMLDLTFDTSKNAMTYFYAQATNWYLSGTVSSTTSTTQRAYVRDTQLARVDYGQTFAAATTPSGLATLSAPEAKVEFNLVKRCVEYGQFFDALTAGAVTCAFITSATASSFPDVPADLICVGTCTPNAAQNSPVYFSAVRLNQINTFVRDAAGAWQEVDTNQLISAFPTTNDGSARSLWLDSVYTHAWGDPSTTADDEDTYLIKFSGVRLNNRVDWNATVAADKDPQRSLDRMRISSVWTEMGGRIDVTYAAARTGDLSALGVPGDTLCPQDGATATDYVAWIAAHPLTQINSAANTQLCYAVKRGADTEIFHNYVATQIQQVDTVAGTPTQTHSYAYGGTPGYGLADSVLYAPGSTGDTSTYSSYRGFLTVSNRTGDPIAVVPASDLRTGDFNGDGKADLFTSTAAGQWMYSSGGTGPWVNLRSDPSVALVDLRFGDFNGDGKTDVFSRTSAGQWRYSSGGTGPWVNLMADASIPLSDLRFGDFNGDGKTDVFSHQPTGRWEYSPSGAGAWVSLTGDDATAFADLRFGDFNGDGKTDVFSRSSTGQWRYSPGGIDGYVDLTADANVPLSSLVLADVDGDHKADVVTADAAGNWRYSSGGTLAWAPLGAVTGASLTESQLADFTGDGKADLVQQEPLGARRLSSGLTSAWSWLAAPTTTTTTNQYYRGLALPITSLYDRVAKTDDPRLQGRLESSTTTDPGAGTPLLVSSSATSYAVTPVGSAPAWNVTGLSLAHSPYVVQTPTAWTKSIDGAWSAAATTSTTYDGALYVPLTVTQTSTDGVSGQTETQCVATTYVQGTAVYIVAPSVVSSFKGTCAAGTLTGKAETLYDGKTTQATNVPTQGLVTKELSYTTASASTVSTAAYDARGRITDAWTPLDQGSATPSVHWAYATDKDGTHQTTITRPLGQVSATWTDAARGNTVKSAKLQGVTASDLTYYQYDALGLLVAGWAPADYGLAAPPSLATNKPTALFVYNVATSGPTIRTKPVVVTSAQHVADNGSTYAGDALTSTVRRSYTFLDGWGRTLETHVPASAGTGGQTVTATHYNALGQTDWTSAPFWNAATASVLKQDASSGLWKSALVNPARAGLPSYTLTSYDTRGRSISQSLASHGNVVSVGGVPDTTSTTYAGPTTATIAPDGSKTSSTSDVLGRMISQTQYAATGHTETPITTTYAYATLTDAGKVGFARTTVTDGESHSTLFESNLAGQRTHMVDPAAGSSDYRYDANGQTLSVTSAVGTPAQGTVAMTYDALGRMTQRTSGLGSSTTGSSSATWDYVTPGETGAATDLGLLRSSSSTTVTRLGNFTTTSTVAYNALHQPVSSTLTLPQSPSGTTLMGDLAGLNYTTGASYDALGQVTSTTMPALGGLPNEKSVVGYRLSGQAQTLKLQGVGNSVSTTLVSAVAMDGTGQLASRTYGNGVSRGVSYDPVTRQVSGLSASFPSGTVGAPQTTYVQADSYTRDALGRLTRIASAVPNGGTGATASQVTGQCFRYDGFNRLTSAWTIAGTGAVGACGTTAPTSSTATGWDASATAYATSWSYSPAGKIATIINGATTPVTANLAYGQNGVLPSAVTSMRDGTTTDSYTYDGAGRQINRTVNGQATALSWDVSSNLVETSGAGGDVLYVYDASGQRVAKIQVADASHTGAVTGYMGSTELTDANTSVNATNPADLAGANFITGTRYYTFGGATVAVRQVTPGAPPATSTLSLMFGDEQGSAQVMMQVTLNPTTGAMVPALVTDPITRNAYTPYGAVRGADNLSIDRGWLNKIADTVTGLTYLSARYYDALTSRFISPDPLLNPMDPKTLDAFRYADNNPVTYTDATGLVPSCPSYLSASQYASCEAYANSPVNYFTGAPTTGQQAPGTTHVVNPQPSPSAGNGFPLTGVIVGGAFDAGKALRQGLASGASHQGLLMSYGQSNSLWKYSPRSGGGLGATYRVTSSGVMRALTSDAAVTGVGALLTYKANSGLYLQVDNQALRQTVIVSQTAMQVGAGALTASVVAEVGFLACGESWGIGCAVGVAALAAGAAGVASQVTGDQVKSYVNSELPVYVPQDPWWAGKPGYDPGVLGPPSGFVGQIPGLNAPGVADAYTLTGSSAIPQFSDSGAFVGMVCGPAN